MLADRTIGFLWPWVLGSSSGSCTRSSPTPAVANDLIRVIAKCGEDYEYRAKLFQRLTLAVKCNDLCRCLPGPFR